MGGILAELNNFGPLTASGMVLLAVFLIFRGNLVPRLYYDELRKDRDEWKLIASTKDGTIAELLTQQRELLDASLTTKRVIESLPTTPEG